MKKIYIALAVLATALLSSCVQEKSFKDIVVNENDIAFVMQGASTRSAEGIASPAVKGITIPMGTIDGEALYLEETIQEMNPSPATRGIPVYNENLGIMHKTLGVYAKDPFGDAVFEGMDEEINDGGWRYWHNYGAASPWPESKTQKVDFYLRLPATPEGVEFTKRDGGVTEFTLESPLNGEDQQDVVLGHVNISKKDHDDYLPAGYPVHMQHALTGIKFANGHENDTQTKTIITRVEIIGLNGSGKCTIDAEGNISWSGLSTPSTADAPFYLEFANPKYALPTDEDQDSSFNPATNPDGTVGTSGVKTWDSTFGSTWTSAAADHNLNESDGSKTFWFIPQEITNGLTLKVYFTVKTPDSRDGFVSDACHTIELGKLLNEKYQSVEGNAGKNLNWEAGQLRTYTLSPYDVDVDIKDVMSDENTKEQLHIANTGNVDEYVRMLIMGNWYGWTPDQDPDTDEPSILVGYKYSGEDDPELPAGGDPNEMVLPWYREGYDLDNNPLTPNVDPYGSFDNSFKLAKLSDDRDGAWEDWADASGGFYYTTPVGPGDGVNVTQSATKDLFKWYKVNPDNIPVIWLATSSTARVKAVGVHLRMEIVVQSIAVPKDAEGKPVYWLEAWYEATGVKKLKPDYENSDHEFPNQKYVDRLEDGQYPGMSAGPGV